MRLSASVAPRPRKLLGTYDYPGTSARPPPGHQLMMQAIPVGFSADKFSSCGAGHLGLDTLGSGGTTAKLI
jgi:hypothetical protein